MRNDEGGGGRFEFADASPKRSRRACLRFRLWTQGRIALLLAVIGMPWLPASDAPPEDLPMRLARGDARTLIWSLAVSPDGQTIATTDERGRVRLRPVIEGRDIARRLHISGYSQVVAFSPDGSQIAIGRKDRDVTLSGLGRCGPVRPLGIPTRQTNSLRFSPDRRTLAVSSDDSQEIVLWDLESGRRWTALRGHTTSVMGLAFAADGRSLASLSLLDPVVLVWDLATHQPRRVPTEPSVLPDAFSPDGRPLATTNADLKIVRVWDVRSGGLVRLISGLPAPIRSAAFSPSGRLLAAGFGDRFLSLWSVATGSELRRMDASGDHIRTIAFSPDGRMRAAAGNDGDVRLWELDGVRDMVKVSTRNNA
jgi:WD40 repeat protein